MSPLSESMNRNLAVVLSLTRGPPGYSVRIARNDTRGEAPDRSVVFIMNTGVER